MARVRGRKVVILEVKPKSPAQSAGIRAGMEILEINGTKTAKLSWQEIVIGKLTDPNAKQIKLLCRPKNTTASTEYTITQK
ncbi:MAG: PDZ domain-containing protein [Planctomycetes bacterium]|nr:PDZ domain-containing protein [Planctomycetota bacterium]